MQEATCDWPFPCQPLGRCTVSAGLSEMDNRAGGACGQQVSGAESRWHGGGSSRYCRSCSGGCVCKHGQKLATVHNNSFECKADSLLVVGVESVVKSQG